MVRKIITTENGVRWERVSRWIKLDTKEVTTRHKLFDYGDPYDCKPGKSIVTYFRYDGKEYALGQFERFSYPKMWKEKGKTNYLFGYDCTEFYYPLVIEIDKRGEMIRLYIEVE